MTSASVLARASVMSGASVGLAHDLPHHALRHLLHGVPGVLDIEQVFLGVPDHPAHCEPDNDDVLVSGEHQALGRHIAAGPASGERGFEADLGDVHGLDLCHAHLLDRRRQPEVQARVHLAVELAEAKHDGVLIGSDHEEEGEPSRDHRPGQHQQEDHEAGRPPAPRHDLLETVLTALQKLLEVGLLMRPTRWALPPGATATAAAPSATTTTLVVPRHRITRLSGFPRLRPQCCQSGCPSGPPQPAAPANPGMFGGIPRIPEGYTRRRGRAQIRSASGIYGNH